VHPDVCDVARTIERGARGFQRKLGRLLPCGDEIRRDDSARQQERARLLAEAFDVQARTMRERLGASDGVDAADEAAQPFECFGILELGRASAAARKDRERKPP
jgi:hypothetical protein